MKTLEELGISLTPWRAKVWHVFKDVGWVCDKNDRAIFGVLLPSHAHLIAAAPDLYEALRECLEVLDKLEKYYQGVDAATYKTMAKARAALEKAGGKECSRKPKSK